MAEETAPKVTGVPKWAWTILIVLTLILLSGLIVGSYFFKDRDKEATGTLQTAVSSSQDKKEPTPEVTRTETKDENVQAEKFLVFALLGVILLGIALIPNLPTGKFLGGVGATLLIFGTIMCVIFWTWPELTNQKHNILRHRHNRHTKISTAGFNTKLPANANLVITVAPDEKAYFAYEHEGSAPPELWTKDSATGRVVAENPWPQGSRVRWIRNPIQNPIEIYAVLPPGQNISASEKPIKIDRIAQASTVSTGKQHLLPGVIN